MKMRIRPTIATNVSLVAIVLAGMSAVPAAADPVEDFYKDTTVTMQIGLGVGGGYDLYARMLARHIGKHIPGNPSVIAKNLTGAGGMRAANYMYNIAPRDGREISVNQAPILTRPIYGDPKAKFDATKFTWIGSMNKDVASCGVWHTAGIERFDDLLEREVTFGASGASGMLAQHAAVLKNLFDAKAKVILGYKGSKDVNLAMQGGEVHGSCALFASTVMTRWKSDWESGRLKIIVQMGTENHPAFEGVPNLFSYAKTTEDRQTLQLIFGQGLMGRPVFAPPGVPVERRNALRKAMADTFKDPAFLAETEKVNMEVNLVPAEEIEGLLAEFAAMPPAVIKKAEEALKVN